MMTDVRGAAIGAGGLDQISAQAESVVMQLKQVLRQGGVAELSLDRSEARRFSLRDIAADYLDLSPSRVSKIAAGLDGLPKASDGPKKSKNYTLADLVRIREAAGRHRYRKPGEPLVTVGVLNFKGGVAKSTTAAHLGHHLALHGYRTLAIDCDPQATLSTLFGIHPDLDLGIEDTLVPYFAGQEEGLEYCIRQTEVPTLSVIPANVNLAEADQHLPARQTREATAGSPWLYWNTLRDGIARVQDRFDVVLLDCPPSFSYLTTVALQAADALVVPMRPSMPDFASSAQFMRMFAEAQRGFDEYTDKPKTFDWLRVLVTLGERNAACREMEDYIRAAYGDLVLPQTFPYMSAVATAAKSMRTVYDVGRGAVDSRALAKATRVVDLVCAQIEELILESRERLSERLEAAA